MEERKVLKENMVKVVGELLEYNLSIKEDREGKEYISGQVIVKSIIDGVENLIPVEFYSRAVTQTGAPNKLFASYVALGDKVGQRISISGEIQENRWFSENSGQVTSYNRVGGRFINAPRANEQDAAEFSFAGYVLVPVTERLDKDGKLIFHEITIAEANYNNEFPIVVKFAIKDAGIAATIQDLYSKGDTVKVMGNYEVETSSTEVEEETAFGDPIKKVYTSTFRNFVITSGTHPADEGAYDSDFINALNEEYANRGVEIEQRAKDQTGNATQKDAPAAKRGIGKALL